MVLFYARIVISSILVLAVIYAKVGDVKNVYSFLLPLFVVLSLILAIQSYGYLMELFVAHFSGAKYELEDGTEIINPQGIKLKIIVQTLLLAFPLLCLIPAIGRRPMVVIFLVILSLVPIKLL